ncbi:MAG: hypothetical protein FK734_06875 [Asgard group archaeon]|nr:hypothetical protein [Asgard group archaeon]
MSFSSTLLLTTNYNQISFNYSLELQFQIPSNLFETNSILGDSVVIIVESTLWGSSAIKTAVNQYRLDLNNTGYLTYLHTGAVANVTYLKQLLYSYWIYNQITGAILIGNLPYAQFYDPGSANFGAETFICDLFLMDLDGTWMDGPTPDGIYDSHWGAPGDIYPEIFVGRIDASKRTLGGLTNEQNIINLLTRIHNYRLGGVSRSHKALTYIDDDWQAYANGTYDNWPGWLQNPYPVKTDIHTPTTYTNGTDWLNRITQDYEWTHLCVHSGSSPSEHYFGPGGVGEGIVTANQIHSTRPTFNFYNLFCCKGADWTQNDCLATTYLYSSDYSLCVIGTAKTGGMISGSSFYNSLGQNESIGKSFYNWFQSIDSYSTEYVGWFYGMTIFGDPTLQIHYDCTVNMPTVSSTTHPNQYQWYQNNVPSFNWTEPLDINSIIGYYYLIDHSPLTIPNKITGTFTAINGTTLSSPLAEGTWFIHVVAKDGAGNIGTEAAHYQFLIDNNPPAIFITAPTEYSTVQPGSFNLEWSVQDDGSGYQYAAIYVDNIIYDSIYYLTNTVVSISELGTHTINVTAFDYMGYSNSDEITITIESTPLFPTKYIIIIGSSLGGVLILIIIVVVIAKKRRKIKK